MSDVSTITLGSRVEFVKGKWSGEEGLVVTEFKSDSVNHFTVVVLTAAPVKGDYARALWQETVSEDFLKSVDE